MSANEKNSSMVNYTKLSPNKTDTRKHSTYNPTGQITKITIHHMAGNLSVETCGNVFASPSRQASSNYGIGTDGRVGMYVEEKCRSWCSSNAANDYKAITIEVANSSTGGNWPVSDKAYASLIALCIDICKRNSIKELVYDGTPNGSLTRHNMFSATTCPGKYLQDRFSDIAKQVNAALKGTGSTSGGSTSTDSGSGSTSSTDEKAVTPFTVQVKDSALNVRKGPGTSYGINTVIKDKGVYTIIATNAAGTWGKLKSGAGWICITSNYVQRVSGSASGSASANNLKAGDKVTLQSAPVYASATAKNNATTKGGDYFVYDGKQVSGRIRITNSKSNVGKAPAGNYVTGWVNVSDCK